MWKALFEDALRALAQVVAAALIAAAVLGLYVVLGMLHDGYLRLGW
jgi:hypothetical protein